MEIPFHSKAACIAVANREAVWEAFRKMNESLYETRRRSEDVCEAIAHLTKSLGEDDCDE